MGELVESIAYRPEGQTDSKVNIENLKISWPYFT